MFSAVASAAEVVGLAGGSSFSRGASALYSILRAIAQRDGQGEVVVPSICCEAVALAVVYSGHRPRFVDVSRETLCMTPASVAPAMSECTRAVVVVHAFGADADAAGFLELRRTHGSVVFIEDIAQAVGGLNRSGKPLGGDLDCALLSFADGKIVAGDGGMLLYAEANARCPDPAAIESAIPATAARLPQSELARELRNLTHAVGDRWRDAPEIRPAPILADGAPKFRNLMVCAGGIRDEEAVRSGFRRLPQSRAKRYGRYMKYRDGISVSHARVLGALREGSTCWRASVLFERPSAARAVTKALRSKGIHASNHYLPLHLQFGGGPLPESEFVAARVVNLWVDETAPETMIDGAIEIINGSRP